MFTCVCTSSDAGLAFTSLLIHEPRCSSSLYSSCAVSTGLKNRCQYGFLGSLCCFIFLSEEMFEKTAAAGACKVLQVHQSLLIFVNSCLLQPLHLNLQLSKRQPSSNNSVVLSVTSYIGVVKIVLSPPPLPFSLLGSAQDQAFCIFEFAPLVSIPTLPVPDPVAGRYLV